MAPPEASAPRPPPATPATGDDRPPAGTIRRIAVVMHDMRGGGAERMMINLAAGFADRGLAVDLVCVRAAGALADRVDPRVQVVDLACPRTVASVPRLARYLRRARPEVAFAGLVHVNTALVLANRLAGRPSTVVVSERNTTSVDAAAAETLAVRLAHKAIPVIYRMADGIATVSEGVADDLAAHYRLPRHRIAVLRNPVVTPDLDRMAAADPGHPWLAPGEPPVVLGAGRLAPQKDFPTLLTAFAEVRRRRPDARLVILGEGADRSALEAQAAELGIAEAVRFPGYDANPYAWMRRAAVFALSSRWEGSPNALVEAMACGTPVVSTDCPSGPREITDGGRLGRLVPVGDAAALAEAIVATLDAPPDRDALIQRAGDYRQETAAAAHLALFERLRGG